MAHAATHQAPAAAPNESSMLREQVELHHGVRVLTTTQVGERLAGMRPTASALLALGIQPVQRTRLATYWALRDMPRIRQAIAAHVLHIQPDEE